MNRLTGCPSSGSKINRALPTSPGRLGPGAHLAEGLILDLADQDDTVDGDRQHPAIGAVAVADHRAGRQGHRVEATGAVVVRARDLCVRGLAAPERLRALDHLAWYCLLRCISKLDIFQQSN